MSAPERIWAIHWNTDGPVLNGGWADTIRHFGGGIEYVRADLAPQWRDIATAPIGVAKNGKLPICWMRLAWEYGGEYSTGDGMRIGDNFYAVSTYYTGGPFNSKQFTMKESEVTPTHWMPLPTPPETKP